MDEQTTKLSHANQAGPLTTTIRKTIKSDLDIDLNSSDIEFAYTVKNNSESNTSAQCRITH